jgi:hypothetical protein
MSRSPCTCSTATASDGWQRVTSFQSSPARLTMAAMREARSHAIRCDMKPPFECPVK